MGRAHESPRDPDRTPSSGAVGARFRYATRSPPTFVPSVSCASTRPQVAGRRACRAQPDGHVPGRHGLAHRDAVPLLPCGLTKARPVRIGSATPVIRAAATHVLLHGRPRLPRLDEGRPAPRVRAEAPPAGVAGSALASWAARAHLRRRHAGPDRARPATCGRANTGDVRRPAHRPMGLSGAVSVTNRAQSPPGDPPVRDRVSAERSSPGTWCHSASSSRSLNSPSATPAPPREGARRSRPSTRG